jgi:hypothetical protein
LEEVVEVPVISNLTAPIVKALLLPPPPPLKACPNYKKIQKSRRAQPPNNMPKRLSQREEKEKRGGKRQRDIEEATGLFKPHAPTLRAHLQAPQSPPCYDLSIDSPSYAGEAATTSRFTQSELLRNEQWRVASGAAPTTTREVLAHEQWRVACEAAPTTTQEVLAQHEEAETERNDAAINRLVIGEVVSMSMHQSLRTAITCNEPPSSPPPHPPIM